ncbi:hypothetical protein [Vibrio phage vB_VpaP_SJSY21]|nr:hypothetical protein [Vibrio phage vB_VpaP_SJSY21]
MVSHEMKHTTCRYDYKVGTELSVEVGIEQYFEGEAKKHRSLYNDGKILYELDSSNSTYLIEYLDKDEIKRVAIYWYDSHWMDWEILNIDPSEIVKVLEKIDG